VNSARYNFPLHSARYPCTIQHDRTAMEVHRYRRRSVGELSLPNLASYSSSDTAQLAAHVLLSIHPTYRANTSPFSLLPQSDSSVSYPHSETSVPDSIAKEDDSLEGRRKAKAVFVVLGRS
jgi:hypothetical protein